MARFVYLFFIISYSLIFVGINTEALSAQEKSATTRIAIFDKLHSGLSDLEKLYPLRELAMEIAFDGWNRFDTPVSEHFARAQLLYDMGYSKKAASIASLYQLKDLSFIKLLIKDALIDHRLKDACFFSEKSTEFLRDNFWSKISILCHILNKENDKARLKIELLQEAPDGIHNTFISLAQLLIGDISNVELPTASEYDLLDLSIMRVASYVIPNDLQAAKDLNLSRSIFRSPNVSVLYRCRVGLRLGSIGLISPSELEDVINSIYIDSVDYDEDFSAPDMGLEVFAKAKLLRQAFLSKNIVDKERIFSLLFADMLRSSEYLPMSSLMAKILSLFSPPEHERGLIMQAIRILMLAKRFTEAIVWYNQETVLAGNKISYSWFIMQLLNNKQDKNLYRNFFLWSRLYLFADSDASNVRRLDLTLALLYALKGGYERDFLPRLSEEKYDRDPYNAIFFSSIWPQLLSSIRQKDAPLALLVIMEMLEGKSLDELHPLAISSSVYALSSLGFEQKAKELALLAAVASGL